MTLQLSGIDQLSPSGASTLIECERKFWWRYAHKLGRDERTEALAMGGGLAEAQEFGIVAGLAEYRARRPILDAFTDPVAYERQRWIGEWTIRLALNNYMLRWPDPPELQREVTYLTRLPGVDRIMQCRVDGRVPGEYLVEDKLRSGSSMRDADLENERLQGDQLTAEIYSEWRATGDLLPVRFRNVKKIDPRKVNKLETEQQVVEVLAAHFDGDVFFEWEVTRSEDQLRRFEDEFAALAGRASDVLASKVHARRNTKACHAYGRTCPALAHCQGLVTADELLAQQAA